MGLIIGQFGLLLAPHGPAGDKRAKMNAQPALSETASPGAPYTDRFWTSQDGLKLHFRDYPGRSDRPPILCLPGLTRNARDFSHVAERLAGEWRVICPDLRGRGDSASA